jgi:hypothetical protein
MTDLDAFKEMLNRAGIDFSEDDLNKELPTDPIDAQNCEFSRAGAIMACAGAYTTISVYNQYNQLQTEIVFDESGRLRTFISDE